MNNLQGIFLVIASMAAFSLEDMFVKHLSETLPIGQILLCIGFGGSVIFGLMAHRKGHALFSRALLQKALILRTLCEVVAAITFTTALKLVPLAVVAAVTQATPLLITMGAALFFKEQVGWRRWSAIAIGFCGVLLIIRPGMAGFDPASLFALASVIAIAARDLLTRRLPDDVSSSIVSFYGFLAICIGGPILLMQSGRLETMDFYQSLAILGAIICGVLGYYAIVAAMRGGDAAAIVPFRYSRLIFSLIIAVVVFHEIPDRMTLIGAALIIATGLYTYIRERRLVLAGRIEPRH